MTSQPNLTQIRPGSSTSWFLLARRALTPWESPAAGSRPEQLRNGSGTGPHHRLEICLVRLLGPERRLPCRGGTVSLMLSIKSLEGLVIDSEGTTGATYRQ